MSASAAIGVVLLLVCLGAVRAQVELYFRGQSDNNFSVAATKLFVRLDGKFEFRCLIPVDSVNMKKISLVHHCIKPGSPDCKVYKCTAFFASDTIFTATAALDDRGIYWCEYLMENGTMVTSRNASLIIQYDHFLPTIRTNCSMQFITYYYLLFGGISNASQEAWNLVVPEVSILQRCKGDNDTVSCPFFRIKELDSALTQMYSISLWQEDGYTQKRVYTADNFLPLRELAKCIPVMKFKYQQDSLQYGFFFPFNILKWTITANCWRQGDPTPLVTKQRHGNQGSCLANQRCTIGFIAEPTCMEYYCQFVTEHNIGINDTVIYRPRWSKNIVEVPPVAVHVVVTDVSLSQFRLVWNSRDTKTENRIRYNITVANGNATPALSVVIPGNATKDIVLTRPPGNNCKLTIKSCDDCGCSAGEVHPCCQYLESCSYDEMPTTLTGGLSTGGIITVTVAVLLALIAMAGVLIFVVKRKCSLQNGNEARNLAIPLVIETRPSYEEVSAGNGTYTRPPITPMTETLDRNADHELEFNPYELQDWN